MCTLCVVVVGEWTGITESSSIFNAARKRGTAGKLGEGPDGEVRCLRRSVEPSLLMPREI